MVIRRTVLVKDLVRLSVLLRPMILTRLFGQLMMHGRNAPPA